VDVLLRVKVRSSSVALAELLVSIAPAFIPSPVFVICPTTLVTLSDIDYSTVSCQN